MCFEATKWKYFSTFLCKHQQGWKCKTEWCWKQSGTKKRLWTNILLRLRFPAFNIRIWGFYTLRSMVDLFLVLIWCQNDCKCWHISTFQMWSFCWGLWRRMWRRPRDLERKGYRIDKAVWHWRSHRLREENNLEVKEVRIISAYEYLSRRIQNSRSYALKINFM